MLDDNIILLGLFFQYTFPRHKINEKSRSAIIQRVHFLPLRRRLMRSPRTRLSVAIPRKKVFCKFGKSDVLFNDYLAYRKVIEGPSFGPASWCLAGALGCAPAIIGLFKLCVENAAAFENTVRLSVWWHLNLLKHGKLSHTSRALSRIKRRRSFGSLIFT